MEEASERDIKWAERVILMVYLRTNGEGPEWKRLHWMLTEAVKLRPLKLVWEAPRKNAK